MTNIAIVTGGSEGLGRAVVAELVRDRWTVLFDGRDARRVAASAARTGGTGVPGDVSDARHRRELVDEARRRGGLNLLVNNASSLGPSPMPRLEAVPPAALRSLVETNVVAPMALVQEALELLRASGGAVVNVTSDAAVEAYDGWGAYGASKAALEQLSRVLALEEAALRVWWADPGDMRTRMHQEAFPDEDISDRPEPETVAPLVVSLVRRRPPSGRVVLSELVGSAR